ncbi:hypothetical protein B0I35DRAFT_212227 [Stachybotrys elegans]|uniref:Uncharacterized protein n=1 Tax=Stachybotrys elegans TaxID=80388 RepID=A0A8K0SUS9_9HYPO|nr:hypothetical protein B0I35DRAFT_212227 [Stachybotrys elegans]
MIQEAEDIEMTLMIGLGLALPVLAFWGGGRGVIEARDLLLFSLSPHIWSASIHHTGYLQEVRNPSSTDCVRQWIPTRGYESSMVSAFILLAAGAAAATAAQRRRLVCSPMEKATPRATSVEWRVWAMHE